MTDADDARTLDERRRRLLRIGGAVAGTLSALAGTGSADVAAGRPVAPDGKQLPITGGPPGHPRPREESEPEPENANGPNERYRQLLAQQIALRDENSSNLDTEAIRGILRDRQEGFDGHLLFFAASDFGQPRVLLPETVEDQDAALQAVLDRIHEQKWRANNHDLREVRHRIIDEVRGIHKGLPALYRDDGSAEYDIVYGWHGVYNFVTIRQVVGLVDWMANAGDRWDDGLRIEY